MSNVNKLNINTQDPVVHMADSEEGTFVSLDADTYPKGMLLGRRTADDKWLPYDPAAGDGTEVPKAYLIGEIAATAAAEESAVFVGTAGELVQELSGVWNAVTKELDQVTPAQRDVLRTYNINVRPYNELTFADNPVP